MIGGHVDPYGRAEQQVRGLFADDEALDRAVVWAREVLANHDIDPVARPLPAIRVLRRAERRLSLVAARYLVDAAAGRGGTSARSTSPFLR